MAALEVTENSSQPYEAKDTSTLSQDLGYKLSTARTASAFNPAHGAPSALVKAGNVLQGMAMISTADIAPEGRWCCMRSQGGWS